MLRQAQHERVFCREGGRFPFALSLSKGATTHGSAPYLQIPSPFQRGFLYEGEDEELPTIYRRPVLLYNSAGQFLGTFNDHPIADDPVRIVLPPGRYIVVSKAQKSLRKVQVEVEDGLTTIVPESLIAQASLVSP